MSEPLYIILSNGSQIDLGVEVSKKLEFGWKCVGGVSHSLMIDTDRDGCKEYVETWAQAMVKNNDPDRERLLLIAEKLNLAISSRQSDRTYIKVGDNREEW